MINSIESKGFIASRVGLFGHAIAFPHGKLTAPSSVSARACGVRASMIDSYGRSFDFVKRTEQAWSISEQPRPIICSSCDSKGHVECEWCAGTGFFILGDNMLCQVPSRNSICVSVLARDLSAALTVKELASGQSGWGNLLNQTKLAGVS